MYIKHTFLSPGVRHLPGVLESLPTHLQDDEVMIACYSHEGNEIVVVGYYKINGFYEDGIACPDGFKGDISLPTSWYTQKARQVCNRDDCWAGGDTGGFYYYSKQ